jgi:phosphoglycerate dehydrogenase-like enzyme
MSRNDAAFTSEDHLGCCNVIAIADMNDDANTALYANTTPNLTLLAVGSSIQEFGDLSRLQHATTIFISSVPNARETLAYLLDNLTIKWIHARSAGIDFCMSPQLVAFDGVVTNARGLFSSSLAESTLLAASHFAKNVPRLLQQQRDKKWCPFVISELRGATLGIVGYGSIGRAIAKLARAYGMKIVAVRRTYAQQQSHDTDEFCDCIYGPDGLNQLFAESDYIVCSAPLTDETKGMIGRQQLLEHAKQDAVFINVGRGPIVDEDALVEALSPGGRLKGAGLDVFVTEPLPSSSPLWNMTNVLVSPHNMDMTATFMHEATEWFLRVNVPRFVQGQELCNQVNPKDGY